MLVSMCSWQVALEVPRVGPQFIRWKLLLGTPYTIRSYLATISTTKTEILLCLASSLSSQSALSPCSTFHTRFVDPQVTRFTLNPSLSDPSSPSSLLSIQQPWQSQPGLDPPPTRRLLDHSESKCHDPRTGPVSQKFSPSNTRFHGMEGKQQSPWN